MSKLKEINQVIKIYPDLISNDERMLFEGLLGVIGERDKLKKQKRIAAKEFAKTYDRLDKMIELLITDIQLTGGINGMNEQEIYRYYENLAIKELESKKH